MIETKTWVSAVIASVMMVGAGTAVTAQSADSKMIPEASEFTPIQRYAITHDRPRDLAEFYLENFGLKAYGADIEQLDHPSNPNWRVILVTIDPIEDPMVSGVQWRFDISPGDGAWSAETAGIRRKCLNGPNAGQWTRDVCP